MELISIILSILCLFFYFLWNTYFKRKSSDPPGLSRKLPILGNLCWFIGNTEENFNAMKSISKECKDKGGVLKGAIGFRNIYFVTDPEDCATVSNVCVEKDLVYKFLKPLLGEGLITGNVTTWKKHRKLLNPAFSQPILNNFIGIFNDQSRRLVGQMSEKIGRPFNHEHLLRVNNLETICITAAGLNCDEYKDYQQKYLSCLIQALEYTMKRFRRFWLHNDFIYRFSKFKRIQDVFVGNMLELNKTIVQKKKYDMKINNSKETLKVNSFLDHILELSERTGCFTDDEIRDETNNIIAAGHDTSANILTCALILLGAHDDVQEKVYEEIQKVIGDTDRDVDKDDFSKLIYMDAVLKETMRLYPIAPVLARYVDKEVILKNYTLQPNHGIFILVWGLHRDPIWGPDAHEFNPERWLNTDTLPDMNYFAGFGLGRRGCIGKVYAMMSMKTTLVHVIRNFKISADISKMIMKLEFLSKVNDADHLTITLRNPLINK